MVNRRHTSKEIVRVKNKRSELPTCEVQLFNDYTDFQVAWEVGHKKLLQITSERLKEKILKSSLALRLQLPKQV